MASPESEADESDSSIYLAKKDNTEKSSKKKKAKNHASDDDEENEENPDTSKYYRKNIKFSGTITLVGLSGGGINGGDIGYFINPDLAIMGRYEQSSFNFNFLGVDLFKYSVKSMGLYGKKFWGNSFYANLGIFHRVLEAKMWDSVETKPSSGTTTSTSLQSAQIVQKASQQDIEIAIGNQWQWDNFTLGCDWIGFMIPISKKIDTNERQISTDGGPYEKDTSKDPDSNPMFPGVRLLAFYLGLSF